MSYERIAGFGSGDTASTPGEPVVSPFAGIITGITADAVAIRNIATGLTTTFGSLVPSKYLVVGNEVGIDSIIGHRPGATGGALDSLKDTVKGFFDSFFGGSSSGGSLAPMPGGGTAPSSKAPSWLLPALLAAGAVGVVVYMKRRK